MYNHKTMIVKIFGPNISGAKAKPIKCSTIRQEILLVKINAQFINAKDYHQANIRFHLLLKLLKDGQLLLTTAQN